MKSDLKQKLKQLFYSAATVLSCVIIIVFGITSFSRSATVTTTIGDNITTNDLTVSGNATTTGSHYIGGNLEVDGSTKFNNILYTWPAADGSSGQALTTNSSGSLSWTTITNGSGGTNYGAAGSLAFYSSSGTTATGTASALLYWDNTNARLGIGTSSPYAKLSVVGETVSTYFTATSTSATSTFPYLASTQSNVGTVVGGTWQGTAVGTQYGGTGQNFSASTGLIYLNAGAASATSTLAVNVGGTGNTSFIGGSLVFSNGSILTQDNSNLYWDYANNRLGIGTTSPANSLHIFSATVPQFRISNDATNYLAASVLSDGGAALSLNGSIGGLMITNPQPAAVSVLSGSTATTSLRVIGAAGGNTTRNTSGIGGIGGGFIFTAGAGGTADLALSSDQGGPGGAINITSGTGGQAAASGGITKIGGFGGDLNLSAGAGGVSFNAGNVNYGGSGGSVVVAGGSGVNASGGTNNYGGSGGSVYISGGGAGAGSSANGSAGNLYLGYNGSSVLGNVYFGDSNTAFISSTGNFGIGTTSPYAKLSVVGQTVSTYFTATSTSATSTFPYLASTQSNVGTVVGGTWQGNAIGVAYGGTGVTSISTGQILVASAANTLQATSTLYLQSDGMVGIGTTTPTARFYVEQQTNDTSVFVVGDAGTSTPALKIDGAGITQINQLQTGIMKFEDDAGTVSWINLPVTSASANTQESYSAMIDDSAILTVYAESNGLGGIQNPKVGIGTTTPGATFAVQGNALADAWLTYEIAEMNLSPEDGEEIFEQGDLLAISDENGGFVKANSANNYPIIGVAKEVDVWGSKSFKPAILGTFNLKVSTENGDIYVGDYLTKSSVDGVAMRANPGDQTVGFALKPYSSATPGIIKIFITLDRNSGGEIEASSSDNSSSAGIFGIVDGFQWILDEFKLLGVTIKDGLVKAKEFIADKITTKELCVEDVCVNRNQLEELLKNININSAPPVELNNGVGTPTE
jgi:hypothetical protein